MALFSNRQSSGNYYLIRMVFAIEYGAVLIASTVIARVLGTDLRTWLGEDWLVTGAVQQLHINNMLPFFIASVAVTSAIHALYGKQVVARMDAQVEAEEKMYSKKRLVMRGVLYGLGIAVILILTGLAVLVFFK